MEWLMHLIKRIFNKREIKLIEAPKPIIHEKENEQNDFVIMLKQTADLERDDRNGYKIIKNLKLKDMV